MDVLERGFERIVYATDAAAGLKAIIAVHDTRLGPSLGGCRMQPYATEEDALTDVCRLAESMTYKAACAGLDLGGGKSVVIADPARDKTEALLRAFGRLVGSLGGRYITAVDVGTSQQDMDEIRRETTFVTSVSSYWGGGGDPSHLTARGVAEAMKACLSSIERSATLKGRKVAIQGAGKVGYHLAGIVKAGGAEVVVADPNLDNLARAAGDFGVSTTPPDEIMSVDCDVFAPCALGAILNAGTIPKLACRVVCGSANNQLATMDDAKRLAGAGILYAPDFVVNAGGLISAADELSGWNEGRVTASVDRIGRTMLDILHRAAETSSTPAEAAVDYAKARIERLSALRR